MSIYLTMVLRGYAHFYWKEKMENNKVKCYNKIR